MTDKHQDPEYRSNARLVRQQVNHARRFGNEVTCQRCGLPIEPEQQYDVGHRDEHGGHARHNLGPEHRYRADCPARGNRSHGGRLGAAITNRARGARTNARRLAWSIAARLFLHDCSHPRLRLHLRLLPPNPLKLGTT